MATAEDIISKLGLTDDDIKYLLRHQRLTTNIAATHRGSPRMFPRRAVLEIGFLDAAKRGLNLRYNDPDPNKDARRIVNKWLVAEKAGALSKFYARNPKTGDDVYFDDHLLTESLKDFLPDEEPNPWPEDRSVRQTARPAKYVHIVNLDEIVRRVDELFPTTKE